MRNSMHDQPMVTQHWRDHNALSECWEALSPRPVPRQVPSRRVTSYRMCTKRPLPWRGKPQVDVLRTHTRIACFLLDVQARRRRALSAHRVDPADTGALNERHCQSAMAGSLEWDCGRPGRSGYRVFISHAPDRGADPGFVTWLVERLAIGGYNAVAHAEDLRCASGDPAVEAALYAAPLVLAIVNRGYLRSEGCLQELRWAREQRTQLAPPAMCTAAAPADSPLQQLPPTQQPGLPQRVSVVPIFHRGPGTEETAIGTEDLQDEAAAKQLIRSLHPSVAPDQQDAWVADLVWLGRLRAGNIENALPE